MRGAQVGLRKGHDDGSVLLKSAEIHLPHQPAENSRAVELRTRIACIEREAGERQSAAARERLMNRGCEIALECRRRQQAGSRIEQATGIDRAQCTTQKGLEGMLADQRQRVAGDVRWCAGYNFEIWQVVGQYQA